MTALVLSIHARSTSDSFPVEFASLSPEELALIAGGFSMGDAVRAGNSAAPAGATAGKYVGAGVGAVAGGVAGSGAGGIGAVPGAIGGAAAGTKIGEALGGAAAWTYGAGNNAGHQLGWW
jgi:hypothetical protein